MHCLLDSGASSHMAFDAHDFTDMKELNNRISISISKRTSVEAIGVGSVPIILENGHTSSFMTFYLCQKWIGDCYQFQLLPQKDSRLPLETFGVTLVILQIEFSELK
uniref:AlNc14C114G6485 protein n=1 Tax=Albugo laibachii Nc14 TaxID=890382 RepID=F0WIV0_9STRA|nr:AlNc14C114G6485 [Albugo laibachii Nc14]|eukprot:CCA21194.1 AlNc14C114G6485 [Albugo laibachii Nc14]